MAKVLKDPSLIEGKLPYPLLEGSDLSPMARLLFGVLMSFGEDIEAGQKSIARRMGLAVSSVKSVRQYTVELKAKGWLDYDPGKDFGTTHNYHLKVPQAAWDKARIFELSKVKKPLPRVGSTNPTPLGSSDPTHGVTEPHQVGSPDPTKISAFNLLKDSADAAPQAAPEIVKHQDAIDDFVTIRSKSHRFKNFKPYKPAPSDLQSLKKHRNGPGASTREEWDRAAKVFFDTDPSQDFKADVNHYSMRFFIENFSHYDRKAPAPRVAIVADNSPMSAPPAFTAEEQLLLANSKFKFSPVPAAPASDDPPSLDQLQKELEEVGRNIKPAA